MQCHRLCRDQRKTLLAGARIAVALYRRPRVATKVRNPAPDNTHAASKSLRQPWFRPFRNELKIEGFSKPNDRPADRGDFRCDKTAEPVSKSSMAIWTPTSWTGETLSRNVDF